MAVDRAVGFDLVASAGSKLDTTMRAEIATVINTAVAGTSALRTTLDGLYGGPGGGLVPPIQFSAQTPVVGGTVSDEAQQARTLTGAKMRITSAPVGSALTVQVQHSTNSGSSWSNVGSALSIAAGSTTAVSVTFSQAQTAGHWVRLNITSIGSTTPAGGVAVDVFRSAA